MITLRKSNLACCSKKENSFSGRLRLLSNVITMVIPSLKWRIGFSTFDHILMGAEHELFIQDLHKYP